MTPANVVSDAGPLHYLILIERQDLLQKLFGKVRVPSVVRDELTRSTTPAAVRLWMSFPPEWIKISIGDPAHTNIRGLDPGESAAIRLATEIKADLVLVDDLAARRAARLLNFRIAGTLSILEEAARRGLVDLSDAIQKLKRTNFHITEHLLQEALLRDQIFREGGKPS
jgi:predicted nucleic acid-binding protein